MSSGYPGPRTALRLRVAANGEAREFTVTDMKDASEVFRGWIRKNDLGSRDLEPEAGEVYDTGTGRVVGRVAYNGRIVLPNPRRARKNPGGGIPGDLALRLVNSKGRVVFEAFTADVNETGSDSYKYQSDNSSGWGEEASVYRSAAVEMLDTPSARVAGGLLASNFQKIIDSPGPKVWPFSELGKHRGPRQIKARPGTFAVRDAPETGIVRGNPPRFREGDIVRMRGADPYSGRRAGQLGVATLVAGVRGKSVYPDPARLMLFCHWDDGVETSVWARSAEKIGRVTFKTKADMIGQFTRFARSRA